METIIRVMQPKDIPEVYRQLVAALTFERVEHYLKLDQDRLYRELFGEPGDWNGLVVILPDDSLIVGFCLYSFANTNRAFFDKPMVQLDHIYILEEYQRLGLGNKLIKELAGMLKGSVDRIELWCLKNNPISQSFYQKLNGEKLDFLDVIDLHINDLV